MASFRLPSAHALKRPLWKPAGLEDGSARTAAPPQQAEIAPSETTAACTEMLLLVPRAMLRPPPPAEEDALVPMLGPPVPWEAPAAGLPEPTEERRQSRTALVARWAWTRSPGHWAGACLATWTEGLVANMASLLLAWMLLLAEFTLEDVARKPMGRSGRLLGGDRPWVIGLTRSRPRPIRGKLQSGREESRKISTMNSWPSLPRRMRIPPRYLYHGDGWGRWMILLRIWRWLSMLRSSRSRHLQVRSDGSLRQKLGCQIHRMREGWTSSRRFCWRPLLLHHGRHPNAAARRRRPSCGLTLASTTLPRPRPGQRLHPRTVLVTCRAWSALGSAAVIRMGAQVRVDGCRTSEDLPPRGLGCRGMPQRCRSISCWKTWRPHKRRHTRSGTALRSTPRPSHRQWPARWRALDLLGLRRPPRQRRSRSSPAKAVAASTRPSPGPRGCGGRLRSKRRTRWRGTVAERFSRALWSRPLVGSSWNRRPAEAFSLGETRQLVVPSAKTVSERCGDWPRPEQVAASRCLPRRRVRCGWPDSLCQGCCWMRTASASLRRHPQRPAGGTPHPPHGSGRRGFRA
mmetsp:Transcript_127394/g.407742  ORF Transcript_127394/g.407742 Transcript_127394/m.407742 type:complete len:572 (+) Transcript_127394:1012-2727(+)